MCLFFWLLGNTLLGQGGDGHPGRRAQLNSLSRRYALETSLPLGCFCRVWGICAQRLNEDTHWVRDTFWRAFGIHSCWVVALAPCEMRACLDAKPICASCECFIVLPVTCSWGKWLELHFPLALNYTGREKNPSLVNYVMWRICASHSIILLLLFIKFLHFLLCNFCISQGSGTMNTCFF